MLKHNLQVSRQFSFALHIPAAFRSGRYFPCGRVFFNMEVWETLRNPITSQPSPVETGQFTWFGLALGLAASLAVGVIYAWIAQRVQPHFAPLGLFPILIGVLTGATIVGVVRFARIGNRPTIFLSALLAAVVATGGQHYFSYLSYVSAYEQASSPLKKGTGSERTNENPAEQLVVRCLSPFFNADRARQAQSLAALRQEAAPNFGHYMHAQAQRGRPLMDGYAVHGWLAWLSWAIDALLVAASAVVVTIPAARVPYCNRCGTWYRTVRCGRLDVPTAQRLAGLFGVEDIPPMRSPRYRLSACQSGCGPTRCELSWEESHGAVDLVRVWLNAQQRNQVTAILDELSETDNATDN